MSKNIIKCRHTSTAGHGTILVQSFTTKQSELYNKAAPEFTARVKGSLNDDDNDDTMDDDDFKMP
eukprot:scaffold5843_cov86-Cylindrotheca_fusiformis.AAC.1